MRITRFLVILVLSFLSATALWGGTVLIANSHGNPWGMMPSSLLAHSPFHSWLIPGLILFSVNGLLALWVLWLTVRRGPRYGLWSAVQGSVLLSWFVVECLLLRMIIWPHYLYGALGVILILCGFGLQRVPDAHMAHPDPKASAT